MAEVAIVGLGFVGGAMFKSFTEKGVNVYGYDKYKNGPHGPQLFQKPTYSDEITRIRA